MNAANPIFSDMELANTAFTVYCECLSVPTATRVFDPMFWEEVAFVSRSIIGYTMRTEGQIHEEDFGKILFGCLTDGVEDKWARLGGREKWTWIAVGRHMINCMMIREEKLNLQSAEGFWPAWVNKKLG